MKSSNFIKKILFILLFSALALFVACGSSENDGNDTPDSGVTDNDSSDTGTSDTDISDTDTSDTGTSDTGANDDDVSDSDTSDSADDSESDVSDTGADTEPVDETDPEFEEKSKGCTMIEVPKIVVGGAYADEVDGYFSPAMGENTIDIIQIMLLGERKEGDYELGTGRNETYMNCKQCVMVWVDAAEGVANEYYFQTHGTLTIKKVTTVDEIERTSGEIKSLVLKQVNRIKDENDDVDFEFIPDGKCIAARIVEWDTTGEPEY